MIDASRDPIATRRLDDLISEAQLVIEPVTEAQARIAREAYRDFGRGSGHPAKLNFGDCFAYALARGTGEPLLFIGNDFALTDVASADSAIKLREMLITFRKPHSLAETGDAALYSPSECDSKPTAMLLCRVSTLRRSRRSPH